MLSPLADSHLNPNFNFVLEALPPAELNALNPHLTPCLLISEQTLYEAGDEIQHVYFPKHGVISLVLGSERGVEVEVGFVGRETFTGAPEILAQTTAMSRAVVQIAGSGWRMPVAAFREQFARGGAFQLVVLRSMYAQTRLTTQCVLCNRLHSVEQRLARWLLMCHDRMQLEELELTHEFIGNMLGTRRVGVTIAAGNLRQAGLIDYNRGLVRILDRAGLEARACECYGPIRNTFDELRPEALTVLINTLQFPSRLTT